jgi:hypothetical protein
VQTMNVDERHKINILRIYDFRCSVTWVKSYKEFIPKICVCVCVYIYIYIYIYIYMHVRYGVWFWNTPHRNCI